MTRPGLFDDAAVAAGRTVRELPRRATSPSPIWYSSSTRRTWLFNYAPAALLRQIEQVVRLSRSKGVACISSRRIPPTCPTRCWGNSHRVQHACAPSARATEGGEGPRRDDARQPALDEPPDHRTRRRRALVSCLDEHGAPASSSAALIVPPQGAHRPVSEAERKAVITAHCSPDTMKAVAPGVGSRDAEGQVRRESRQALPAPQPAPDRTASEGGIGGILDGILGAAAPPPRRRALHW